MKERESKGREGEKVRKERCGRAGVKSAFPSQIW